MQKCDVVASGKYRLSKMGMIGLALSVALSMMLCLCAPARAASTSPAQSTQPSSVMDLDESYSDVLASIDVSKLSAKDAEAVRKGKWIEVRLATQRLIAWQNGRAVMSSAISSGVRAYPTLRGTFHIYVKYRATRMRGPGYNLPNVPYTMYYYSGYAIHGAYWHNNFGHPMSHGCVNLPVSFSRQLYNWASVGTLVYIH